MNTETLKKKGGENGLGKWVKTMVSFEQHKDLKRLAIDEDSSIAEVLREAITNLLINKRLEKIQWEKQRN